MEDPEHDSDIIVPSDVVFIGDPPSKVESEPVEKTESLPNRKSRKPPLVDHLGYTDPHAGDRD